MKLHIFLLALLPLYVLGQSPGLPDVNKNTINGWRNVEISVDSFTKADSFVILDSSSLGDTIVSFQLVIDPVSENELPFAMRTNGNRIKGVGAQRVKSLKAGDRIIIDMIRARGKKSMRALSPIRYKLI